MHAFRPLLLAMVLLVPASAGVNDNIVRVCGQSLLGA